MPKPTATRFRRAGAAPPATPVPLVQRWYGKVLLGLSTVLLLSPAFAPMNGFFLAWVGLVPWLILVRNARTPWRAFWWSWLTGMAFFSANMWWLAGVTGPGLVALMPILGLYWAVAGFILRGTGLVNRPVDAATNQRKEPEPEAAAAAPSAILHPLSSILPLLGIAAVWVTLEWLRGTWPFQGLPWLYLAHTQTPALHMCQLADTVGEMGVSFWVALINAWVFLFLVGRMSFRRSAAGLAFLLLVTAGILGYGFYRFGQYPTATTPGPTVLVVQPNIPQSNTGDKGLPLGDLIDLHLRMTIEALQRNPRTDLVVWSETMMPSLNPQTRAYLRGDEGYGDLTSQTHRLIGNLAMQSKAAFLVGGAYFDKFQQPAGKAPMPYHAKESRNTAYFYDRTGVLSDQRYDKVHLVPFGEYIPFKETIPPLYKLLVSLGPPNMEDYQLARGDESNLTVFRLSRGPKASPGDDWRFVSPICFEDMDGPLVARMLRTPGGSPVKRADFIVNITNDGWFAGGENAQHFQAAQFRSIENRAPTARSVNTGISGFIDSMGRPYDVIPARTEGTRTAQLRLDARVAPFTRIGNAFAFVCVGATTLLASAAFVKWIGRRGKGRSGAADNR